MTARYSPGLQWACKTFTNGFVPCVDDDAGGLKSERAEEWFGILRAEQNLCVNYFIQKRDLGNADVVVFALAVGQLVTTPDPWLNADFSKFRCRNHRLTSACVDEELQGELILCDEVSNSYGYMCEAHAIDSFQFFLRY